MENLKVFVEGEFCTPTKNSCRGSSRFCSYHSIVQSIYKWCPAEPGIHLVLFADDAYINASEKLERRDLCKLQRGLTAMNL
jgi:hypothetical protein